MRRTAIASCLLAVLPVVARHAAAENTISRDSGVAGAKSVEPKAAIEALFSSSAYPFCHEPAYPLTPAEKAWCDLGAADNAKACPQIKSVCANEAGAKQIELREPFSFSLPDLGLPLRLLLWILLGLVVGFVIFALVRHFLDHKSKQKKPTTAAADVAEADRATALARQVETDVQRLLERARACAAAGDFRGAVGDAYAALLRRLEGAGVVRIAPDQTNGDYLRRVRRERPNVARGMSEVVSAVELSQFARAPVTRETFEGVFARVVGLLAERIGLVLLMALSLTGLSCGQPRDDWDHSPSGRAAIIDFLGKRGFTVRERLSPLTKLADISVEQLVVFPGAQLGEEAWQAVAAWMQIPSHTLVVAGGGRPLPTWLGMKIAGRPAMPSEPLALTDADRKRWGKLRARVPEGNVVERGEGPITQYQTILTRNVGDYALIRWLPLGDAGQVDTDVDEANAIVVLADDHLFRNVSLLVSDNAILLENLLRDGGSTIELVGDLTGLVASNPVQSVQRGRLGPALMQLAGLLLLFFVCVGARFGRPVASETAHRREYSEHVRAVGLHYARARADRLALGFIGAYVSERLRERFRLRADRSLSGLAEAVAARTGRPVGQVMRLLVEARDASKGETAERDARDLETAKELCSLLEETGGTGGHKPIQSRV